MIKDKDEHPDGGDALGKVCGKHRRALMPSLSMPPSQHLYVFSSLQALRAFSGRIFMDTSLHMIDLIIGH